MKSNINFDVNLSNKSFNLNGELKPSLFSKPTDAIYT